MRTALRIHLGGTPVTRVFADVEDNASEEIVVAHP
jgi:hypothetical protein